MENKQYTRDEVYGLMCKAFEHGFKKYDVVDAGLESKETDIECAWILHKYDIESNKKVVEIKQTAVEWFAKQVLGYKSPTNINGTDYISIPTNKIEFLQEQAKEMEKNQIIDGVYAGYNYDGARLEEYSEQYYNETYGKE